MTGSSHSYKHSFDTTEGENFEEEVRFVYARSWMLREFPESHEMQGDDAATINIVAKAEFAHDVQSDNFDLNALPSNMMVK